MLLGAHVSTQGGVGTAPENASRIGAEAIQIFTRNQRAWRSRPLPEEEVKRFRSRRRAHGVRAAIAHDSYLSNLASPDPATLERSRLAFTDETRRADALGRGARRPRPRAQGWQSRSMAVRMAPVGRYHMIARR